MILDDLNDEQKNAVTETEGFVRVIAGAGSGKTKALTHRFAYLINDIGVLPSHILCVTFTNKAANEMKQRIKVLTNGNDTGYINTFHGFCVSVLQEDSNQVQYPKSFLVLDNSDIDSMLDIIYEERGLTLRQMTYSNARDMIEILKLKKIPDYYLDMITMSLEQVHEKYLQATKTDEIIFYGYLYQEKKCFGLDYNDLIKFVLFIFSQSEETRIKWQERLEYIMIDEFQDIDDLQYELMKTLCDYHKNLFIMGDPDQTIYTWRGADVKFLLNFDQNYPDTKTIMMNTNYRSTPEILDVANSLIDKNNARIKKDLVPTLPSRQKVIFHHAKTSEDEALWIVNKIKELIENEVKPNEITILFRAHYISRVIEEVLQKKEIPYTLFSGVPFFNRAEIKDAISYLKMVAFKDDLSFLRVANTPKRNIGERRIKFLKDYAEKNNCTYFQALKLNLEDEIFKNTKAKEFIDLIEKFSAKYQTMQISDLINQLLNQSGYEKMLRTEGSQERLDNLAELKQSIYEYENLCGEECTLENFLAHTALFTSADSGTEKNAIKLMTIHTAKGLEFPYVFLCGMNENMFPSKKIDTQASMEEERRLAFVAFTRAKYALYLSDAEGTQHGFGFRFPSRFIFDVDKELLEYTQELDESLVTNALSYISASQKALENSTAKTDYEEGDKISHGILGNGTILKIDSVNHAYLISFDGIKTPRKISFKAPIKLVSKRMGPPGLEPGTDGL